MVDVLAHTQSSHGVLNGGLMTVVVIKRIAVQRDELIEIYKLSESLGYRFALIRLMALPQLERSILESQGEFVEIGMAEVETYTRLLACIEGDRARELHRKFLSYMGKNASQDEVEVEGTK